MLVWLGRVGVRLSHVYNVLSDLIGLFPTATGDIHIAIQGDVGNNQIERGHYNLIFIQEYM